MQPDPIVDRPAIPAEYGTPKDRTGLLPWSHVVGRLTEAPVYWLATVGRGGRPRTRPLDGTFVDGVLYVGGSTETAWVRDLLANPYVSVSLDGGADVVIVEGEAEHMEGRVSRDLAERLAAASNAKYPQYGMTADAYGGAGMFGIRPRWAIAWTAFPKDVTRFRFPDAA